MPIKETRRRLIRPYGYDVACLELTNGLTLTIWQKCDISTPGAKRPLWVWANMSLDKVDEILRCHSLEDLLATSRRVELPQQWAHCVTVLTSKRLS